MHVDEPRPNLQAAHVVNAIAALRTYAVGDLRDERSLDSDVLLSVDAVGGIDHPTALQNRSPRRLDPLPGIVEAPLPYRRDDVGRQSYPCVVSHVCTSYSSRWLGGLSV